MRKSLTDILCGTAFLAISAAFGCQYQGLAGVSRIFPESLIFLISAGGLWFVGKGLYERRGESATAPEKVAWKKVGRIAASATVYAAVIRYPGFFQQHRAVHLVRLPAARRQKPGIGPSCRCRSGLWLSFQPGGLVQLYEAAQCADAQRRFILNLTRSRSMRHTVPYGKGSLSFELPESAFATVFEPRQVPPLLDPLAAFEQALDAPEHCPRLEDLAAPSSIAIAVPDETRPFPTRLLLPLLLNRIFKAWPALSPTQICIVVGGGLHAPADTAQFKRILPDDLGGCRVLSHDALRSPMLRLGTTERGTPVEINAVYAQAALKIVMGMVDAHQFVGFTGGAKGVVVGCASAAMIQKNHAMLSAPEACAGSLEHNPVREDLNEAGRIVGVNLAVNVALDAQNKIIALFAGDPAAVRAPRPAKHASFTA